MFIEYKARFPDRESRDIPHDLHVYFMGTGDVCAAEAVFAMILLDRYRLQGKRIHAHLVDPVYRVYGTGRAVCDRFVELIARIMPEGDADRVSVEFHWTLPFHTPPGHVMVAWNFATQGPAHVPSPDVTLSQCKKSLYYDMYYSAMTLGLFAVRHRDALSLFSDYGQVSLDALDRMVEKRDRMVAICSNALAAAQGTAFESKTLLGLLDKMVEVDATKKVATTLFYAMIGDISPDEMSTRLHGDTLPRTF
jgi:hypothetical protein